MQHRIFGESPVQDAIVAALSEYCYGKRLRFRHTLPYSNQQGFKPNDVCGDLIAAFGEVRLFAIEIKAATLHAGRHQLQSFKDDQLKNYADLKTSYGLPIFYAYNAVETLSQNKPGGFCPFRCVSTLSEVHLAQPDDVDNKGIVGKRISTLLEYLQDEDATRSGGDKLLARILQLQTAEISNSILVIAFGKDKGMFNLNIDEIRSLADQMANSHQLIDATRFPLCWQFADQAHKEKKKKNDEKAAAERAWKAIADASPSIPKGHENFGRLGSEPIKNLALSHNPDNKKNKTKGPADKLKN
jgi:hypothetical protein